MVRCSRSLSPGLAVLLVLLLQMPAWAVPWLPFGPDGGFARKMASDPRDPAHLYLGAADGWLYESHNFGHSWARLANIGKRDDLVLDSIVVDAADPLHLIVGAYDPSTPDGGMFISQDGGKTWLNQAEMRGQSVRSLSAAPSDAMTMVAGTLQGVFRTVDGGKRWKQISPPSSVEIHNVESVAIDPRDSNIIYAGTWHLPWKTTDGGEHWSSIKEGIIEDSDVFSIIVDPVKPEVVYASACSGIYKSLNAGLEFTKVQGIPSDARRTRVLLQDPNRRATVYAGTTEGLFRSVDAGRNWVRTTGPEIVVNDVAINASDSRQVLLATDRGGLLASDDGGDTFHASNAGFSTRQIMAMQRDRGNAATLYVGVVNDKEWGGVFRSSNGGLAWTQRSEGLQGRDVFALGQAPDGTIVAGTSHGLFLLDQEAGVWQPVAASPVERGSAAATESGVSTPVALRVRPPVPVGRNSFAERKLPKNATPAQRRAAVIAAHRKPVALGGTRGTAKPRKGADASHRKISPNAARRLSARKDAPRPLHKSLTTTKRAGLPLAKATVTEAPSAEAPPSASFDGSVSGIVTSGQWMLASTSMGLLTSSDDARTWTDAHVPGSKEWRLLAAAKGNVVAASFHSLAYSADSGATWVAVRAPEALIQIEAIAVEPNGEIWVGGGQGVFVSADAGSTWTTPKNLYVTSIRSLYFDEATDRMIVTTGGNNSVVFTVQMPQRYVTYAYSGWNLRFARPVGDHLVAATLFDGIVVQPKMMDSPATTAAPAKAAGGH